MTWREDLRRVNFGGRELVGASFRGVVFFVDTSERGGGRRTVVHEFPLIDDPFVEDLGRTARTFHVEGYVLGDDYLAQRDALLSVLEDTEGPGELVHPYHGVKRAICQTVSVREQRTDGGFASFSMAFVETPAQVPVPLDTGNAADQVSAAADAADTATDAELDEKYDATGLPAFALASAETAVKNAATAIRNKLGPVVSATQDAALLTSQVTTLTAEASSLVRTPAVILGKFRDAAASLGATALNAPEAVMKAMIDAYSFDIGPIVGATTTTRAKEIANQTALVAGLRRVFVVQAARLAPLVPYVSIDDAIAARDQIAGLLDDQAAIAGDTAYPALVELRSQVLSSVPGSTAFARVVTVTRQVPIPSLLLAYQLYGSEDLEPDILARNNIRHPGLVVGDLKVLSDV